MKINHNINYINFKPFQLNQNNKPFPNFSKRPKKTQKYPCYKKCNYNKDTIKIFQNRMSKDTNHQEQIQATGETANKNTEEKEETIKRKVAMHLGYIGSNYYGFQFIQDESFKSVERELLKALIAEKAINEQNFGEFDKLGWGRNSRTDKGVHSLETVITIRYRMKEDNFEKDPEGQEIVNRLNSHLPDDIRIFSLQRVTKSFNPRKFCISRTYVYYLPIFVLMGKEKMEYGSQEEKDYVMKFREVVKMFEGHMMFHNYTKRSQYTGNSADTWSAFKRKNKKNKNKLEYDSEDSKESTITNDDDDEPEEKPDELLNKEGKFKFWKYEIKTDGKGDPVSRQHYRKITKIAISDAYEIIEGGTRVVKCEIEGQSFMLNQIRKMIGTAIAVTRNYISMTVFESSLRACSRITLPKAPPYSLMLHKSTFRPFRVSYDHTKSGASLVTGDVLNLKDNALQRKLEFEQKEILPAVNALLELEDWKYWSNNLEIFNYHEDKDEIVKQTVEKYQEWILAMRARKEERIKLQEIKN